MLSMIMMVAGLILDSVARGRAEQKRIHYLSHAPAQTIAKAASEAETRRSVRAA
jgi:hypothetical protein